MPIPFFLLRFSPSWLSPRGERLASAGTEEEMIPAKALTDPSNSNTTGRRAGRCYCNNGGHNACRVDHSCTNRHDARYTSRYDGRGCDGNVFVARSAHGSAAHRPQSRSPATRWSSRVGIFLMKIQITLK